MLQSILFSPAKRTKPYRMAVRFWMVCFLFSAVLIVLPFFSVVPAAQRPQTDPAPILDAAESVFRNMAKRDYRALWSGLTIQTRQAFVRSVYKALAKEGKALDEQRITADFQDGGPIAVDYWRGYLSEFEPKAVLEESRWSMGDVKKDKAVIILRYRKSEHDSLLMMVYEQGAWKVGLHESFHTRQ